MVKSGHGIIHGRCSPNIILRKNGPTKSNVDLVQIVEGYLFEKWLTPWKAQIVLGGW